MASFDLMTSSLYILVMHTLDHKCYKCLFSLDFRGTMIRLECTTWHLSRKSVNPLSSYFLIMVSYHQSLQSSVLILCLSMMFWHSISNDCNVIYLLQDFNIISLFKSTSFVVIVFLGMHTSTRPVNKTFFSSMPKSARRNRFIFM